jgi:hypothetical protein
VVGVSYGEVQDLIITVSIRVCSAIAPEGVWGQTKVWHGEVRHGLRIPLSEHAGRSLLWHTKSRR